MPKIVAQRYELRETLGEGGMGIVYRALDTRTNSFVAIKTLKDASDPETLLMFRKEWGELAHMSHPNIVGVRDVGEFEENGRSIPFFVMPLLQGCTLAALIKSSSPRLTVENVVEIIMQVCRGLNAAHEMGLIHRDIKPSNIFVMEDGTAQIIDFGLVQSSNARTDTGFKGTLQYMAPEQTEGKKVTRASDIFSLGIVGYEALTGKQPFSRPDSADMVEAVRRFSPPPISEVNPQVSDLVSKAIHVAMAKQPIHRYGSAREFADTLQKAYRNQPIDRFDPARTQPKIERARGAFERGDCDFASELLSELEAEGNVDPQISLLRAQVEESTRQKYIRNLFEAAQTRLEQNEIPLAIAKLSEILRLDPGNARALSMIKAIDEQRNREQVSGWMRLAKQHLERNDFSEARKNLDEVFKVKYDEPEAQRLRTDIEVREKEAVQARVEKEKLYSAALKASERGEISSAISSLERLIGVNRAVPGSAIPERDKVYQAFYNNIVSERDFIDNAYAEGNRYLNEKNFDGALHVCDRVLAKYPNNAQFKALRIKVEGAQRQELSSYIAEVGRAVDSEPSLDRRVGLLEEASKKFPNEQQFVRQLHLAREHRDLVASILAKARAYEEQEQFGEAIQQWKILAGTHPQYVGIDSEISQLEVLRDRRTNEEKRTGWVQKIDQALDNFAYAQALRLAVDAQYDFPGDQELATQERIAKQGLDRILNAERLFEEAKTARTAGQPDNALELLRSAVKEDERHFAARSMLVNLLTEQAHACVDSDIVKAGSLAQAARDLDPGHPSVKRIADVIREKRRSELVAAYSSKARELQNTDLNAALAVIDKGLAEYPGEPRLVQLRNSFANQTKGPPVAPDVSNERTKLYEPPKLEDWSVDSQSFNGGRTVTHVAPVEKPQPVSPKPKAAPVQIPALPKNRWTLIGIGVGIVVLATGLYLALRKPEDKGPTKKVSRLVTVNITTRPADAQLRVDDTPYDVQERRLSLRNDNPHPVKVSLLGFTTFEGSKSVDDIWDFTLTPEPIHLNISTNGAEGEVLYDSKKIGDLNQGSFSNSSIVPDGATHKLSVTNASGEIFAVNFQDVPGKPPVVQPLTVPELIVTGSLGNQATVYSGTPAKLSTSDGQPRTVDSNGVAVDLTNLDLNTPEAAHLEIKPAKSRHSQPISIARGNAPTLNFISSAVPNPNAKIPPAAKTPAPKKTPSALPGFATLVIRNGTPRAKVLLDQQPIAELDSNGALSYAKVPAGDHDLGFDADGYAPLSSRRSFKAGQTLELNTDLKLSQLMGQVTISVSPPNTKVESSPTGKNDWHPVQLPTVSLPIGTYDFAASAPNFERDQKTLTVQANKMAHLSFGLAQQQATPTIAPAPSLLEKLPGLKQESNWFSSETNSWITLSPGLAKYTMIFLRPDRYTGRHKPKRLEWTISLDNDHIAYTVDSHGVNRKSKINGVSDSNSHSVSPADNLLYSFTVVLDAHGVQIRNKDGSLLDEVKTDAKDWIHARIAIKGDAFFDVRR